MHNLNYFSEDTFQKRDLDILDMVSQHIAFALERKEADDAIREQRQIFERIFELSPVGIMLVENRIFNRVNDEFVKIFDYEKKADFEYNLIKKDKTLKYYILQSIEICREKQNILYMELKS